jgi:hypothetical protein
MHGFTDKNSPKSGPLCGMSVLVISVMLRLAGTLVVEL